MPSYRLFDIPQSYKVFLRYVGWNGEEKEIIGHLEQFYKVCPRPVFPYNGFRIPIAGRLYLLVRGS